MRVSYSNVGLVLNQSNTVLSALQSSPRGRAGDPIVYWILSSHELQPIQNFSGRRCFLIQTYKSIKFPAYLLAGHMFDFFFVLYPPWSRRHYSWPIVGRNRDCINHVRFYRCWFGKYDEILLFSANVLNRIPYILKDYSTRQKFKGKWTK